MMTYLIAWFVLAYGFTNIMVYGSIFAGMRRKIELIGNSRIIGIAPIFSFISDILSCMMCCSTWVGFFLGLFIFSPSYYFLGASPFISWFFDGLMASGAVWAINSVIEWFEENRPAK
jgi:hypothetical protein